jgi:hypothetical protein
MTDLIKMETMSLCTYETDSESSLSSYPLLSDDSSYHSLETNTSVNATVKHSSSKWSEEEDQRLSHAVQLYGQKNWRLISEFVISKTNLQCRQRYLKVIAPGIRKGKWSEEEDALLCLVMNQGMTNWRKIAEKVPGRTSKQCRERWNHYLHPDVVKTPFSASEDKTLAKLYKLYGNHWSAISKLMPGRTENQVRFRVEHLKLNKIDHQPVEIIREKKVIENTGTNYQSKNSKPSMNISIMEDTSPAVELSPVVAEYHSFNTAYIPPELLSEYQYLSDDYVLSGDYLDQFLACMTEEDVSTS